MEYINPPRQIPKNMFHKTFYSMVLNHEIGYTIYLPEGYETSDKKYPVQYHLHGWTGNESSEIHKMESIYSGSDVITVFPNSSPVIEDKENLPVEAMLITEFIPYIEDAYRVEAARESRSLSGFSMGGGFAFYLAVKYPELFGAVTAYVGTYHHYYHKDYSTVGEPVEKAAEIYRAMVQEGKISGRNIIALVMQRADQIRGQLQISLHVGTEDILGCDNEILHLHLDALKIPHVYKKFEGAAHSLTDIL